MEGTLQVPPDRGTIIGRALWKSRYVVIGGPQREQSNSSISQEVKSSRHGPVPRILPKGPPESIYLAVYKSKDEPEPVQQHAISSITDAQVQMVAHRKQGPVLPTLIVNISPDPAIDKLRKRRSSRTAGLTSSKDSSPTTLWFRLGQSSDDQTQYTLHDWARCLQQLIQPNLPDRLPMSPISPTSPTFTNPFAPTQRPREGSDAYVRPGSANPTSRGAIAQKGPSQAQPRNRPLTYTESPSLRSKRSDLSSSQASSMKNPLQMAFSSYQSMHPADLPSPAATVEEYQGEFIEGWTSAQGRSSTLSSPVRGRDSFGSQMPAPMVPGIDSSSPPGPRETILDRAFQMRYIPGSEKGVPGEEKLSSLARFDALMREADERRRARESVEAKAKAASASASAGAAFGQALGSGVLKSGWDMDDDSDSEHGVREAEDEDDDSDELGHEASLNDHFDVYSSTQRALTFISARRNTHSSHQTQEARFQGVRPPPAYNHEALMTLSNSGSSHLRPRTGYSNRIRPGIAPRTLSQPQLANSATTVAAMISAAPGTLLGSPTVAEMPEEGGDVTPLHRSAMENRHSTSSGKRLSFTDFTRRLSSTSSLMLVQTNASGASNRGSSDADSQLTQPQQPSSSQPRGACGMPPPPPPNLSDREREAWEKRCGWRGSVGVFGSSEGGFL